LSQITFEKIGRNRMNKSRFLAYSPADFIYSGKKITGNAPNESAIQKCPIYFWYWRMNVSTGRRKRFIEAIIFGWSAYEEGF
jgi:hypothetical protein